MADYPIIMTGESVRATLAGKKSRTSRIPSTANSLLAFRRVGPRGALREIWDRLDWKAPAIEQRRLPVGNPGGHFVVCDPLGDAFHRVYPLYEPGDRLWVREAWAQICNDDGCLDEAAVCPCGGCHVEYRADSECKYPGQWPDDAGQDPECPKWRSPRYMPRWASRLTLEVLSVRAEWLNDIDFAGVQAEGLDVVAALPPFPHTSSGERLSEEKLMGLANHMARVLMEKRWDTINAKRGYPWKDNPPDWGIEYRLLEEGK